MKEVIESIRISELKDECFYKFTQLLTIAQASYSTLELPIESIHSQM